MQEKRHYPVSVMTDRAENPLVSIIVRTKDRPELLKRALKSIEAQTYRPIEVILVNDGGCYLDVEELRGILGDISLNYTRLEENTGRANTGNVGIENARGDYIGFLDDDDELYPGHVSLLVSTLGQIDYKVAYTDSLMAYKEYNPRTSELVDIKKELVFSQDFNYDYLIFENYIPFMCLLFEREVLISSGGFDGNLDIYEDWDLLIRIGEKHAFYHIKQTTADYNQWDSELQIAQRNKDYDFMEQSYLKVLSKHINKVSAKRILDYNSHLADKYKGPYLKAIEALLAEKETALKDIYNSYGWKALLVYYRVRDKLLPPDSLRRQLVRRLLLTVVKSYVFLKNLNNDNSNVETSMREKYQHTAIVENVLREKEASIQLMQSGHRWRLLNSFLMVRDRLLPAGTKRRLFVKLLLIVTTKPKEVFANLTGTNFRKFLYYLKTSDPFTLGKKIEQKLSDEVTYGENPVRTQPMPGLPAQLESKDYFSFLFEMNTNKVEDHVSLAYPDIPETGIKLIAFYLPQFHPIRENDEWWGKGFTEWANVARAVPQFIGHYQPRLPGELGFYDLRVSEVQRRQVELAKQYGIYGFCFHFYWFNGRTLLEKPIKEYVENFDFPFCLNWANENWTRRWDGKENEILMAQKHSPEDDIEFIKYVSGYLKNKNYIRINSRPLVVIYRPSLLPSPKETAALWREWCLNNGIGEIYLVATHSFEHIDPESIGFDAAIDFPPNTFPLGDIADQFKITNPNFKGVLLDYKNAVEFSRNYLNPPYKKFRGICPSWDNEARKPGRGTVIVNSSPDIFKQWLKILCRFTQAHFAPDERIIFINAWNEWAEGAYLEPDRRYGYAYLQAVADALIEYASEKKQKKIIYVCHDAHFHGAQLLSLNILKVLKLKFNFDVHFLLKAGGELEREYAKYGTVYNLERDYNSLKEREKLIEYFYHLGIRDAICNTVASGDLTELLRKKDIRTITLVHELPDIIKKMGLKKNARLLTEYSYKVLFPSDFVREKFKTIAKIEDGKTVILPQGVYKNNGYKGRKDEARKELRERFSLPESAHIILGVGFGDHRKGVDLFVEVAKMVTEEHKDVYFMWVGNLHPEIEAIIGHKVKANKNIILYGAQKDVSLFFAGADIYLLTSREDPFPAVVLEAMDVGLPVIGFSDAGGFKDIVNADTGVLVPYMDVTAMAKEIVSLLADSQRRRRLEGNTQKLIEEKFNFTDYVYRLLAISGHEFKKVSVIIPNFNYEKYLKLRIDSILKQTYPIYEIIFLDDASADNSVKSAEGYLEGAFNSQLIKNEMNSGSAFKQWLKGLQIAKGDYIWIAEADDLCEDTFLEELMSCFEKEKDVVLAYCQSRQIDEDGKIISENYYEYTNDIDRRKWHKDYIRDGIHEISDTLFVKNSIPNVSAVVFKKIDISPIADEIVNFKIAGDWFFYVWLLKHGKIAYVSRSLNSHRRHDKGVTKSENRELHFNEVVRMQEYVMNNFNVPAEARNKVSSYREYLISYFGLKCKSHALAGQ
jgi:glycosyltransferase involved in cell wall biosynthesis